MSTAHLTTPQRRARARRNSRRLPIAAQWYLAATNPKTGPMPSQLAGATEAQIDASCYGCSLAPWADGGCYAHGGNMKRAAQSVRASSKAKDLASVLERTPRAARFVRFGALGDPARVDPEQTARDLATADAAHLGVIGYTHHWRELGPDSPLRSRFLASCETLLDAHEANEAGWHVALAGPSGGVAGYAQCRNELQPWITCSACGLCSIPAQRSAGLHGITFTAHGIGAKRLPLAPCNA